MMKKMLINAAAPEELRVATVQDGRLFEFQTESASRQQTTGNIYKVRVVNVEPSLQAAFVDIGTGKNAFLQMDEIHPEYYHGPAEVLEQSHPPIQKVIRRNQEILVQVTKEQTELKGASVTTFLSLPGQFLVLMPGREAKGVSRKIEDEAERTRLKRILSELKAPDGVGVIARTAAQGRSKADLVRNFKYLLRLWEDLRKKGVEASPPAVIYKEEDLPLRVLRDFYGSDIDEILVDDTEVYERIRRFVRLYSPQKAVPVRLHKEPKPIFSRYQIEEQIESIYQSRVELPAGGWIVIDTTEALVSVDVNSGKATRGKRIEDTAYQTNLEAAVETARQLRLRDLGGLIVIDFIDMRDKKHQNEVVRQLKEELKLDKAKTTVGRISRFGMLEMSRQRIRPSIEFGTFEPCPACGGLGRVRSVEPTALGHLRGIQRRLAQGNVERVTGVFPPEVAAYLLNVKRMELAEMERRHRTRIDIRAEAGLHRAESRIDFQRREAAGA
jgi:ribonuclease E